MTKHKNSNNAIGNFCIYRILIYGKVSSLTNVFRHLPIHNLLIKLSLY